MKTPVVIALIELSLVASGCARGAASPQPAAPAPTVNAVQVVTPVAKLERGGTSASGQIRAVREATLSARVSGTIGAVHVQVGDRVAAGQVLMTLEDTSAAASVALARAALDSARSDLRLAELELERQAQLVSGNAGTRAQLERAQATRDAAAARVASAEANLVIAQRTLADHRIRAPFSGVVTARMKQAGEAVSGTPPTALVTLVDTANLEARLDVPEGAVGALRNGMAVAGRVSPSGLSFEAKVKAIGAAVDPKSRTVEVLLALAPSRDARADLRPGALVTVQLASRDALAGPFVPAKAVQSGAGGAFVWVVKDGKVERRAVSGEPHDAELFRVRSGLSGDEPVVVSDASSLRDGAPVRAVN
ncbi:efflux RND transporter periplasmic adaptor subunit [Anaeromyxobacter oryzisoli]|uniref:efflux RND transporter periplasmic adaptor subunit n=1 Tax=Anaeromyxobacter oryzisoli TaxID=2925408 RepID=UPI001F575293|nr:efflux RND transporter periplasmic adaptor subunit [Anaeromyxobacter sp. SG63]